MSPRLRRASAAPWQRGKRRATQVSVFARSTEYKRAAAAAASRQPLVYE